MVLRLRSLIYPWRVFPIYFFSNIMMELLCEPYLAPLPHFMVQCIHPDKQDMYRWYNWQGIIEILPFSLYSEANIVYLKQYYTYRLDSNTQMVCCCFTKNTVVLMKTCFDDKWKKYNMFWTRSWLSGLLPVEIFISTGHTTSNNGRRKKANIRGSPLTDRLPW